MKSSIDDQIDMYKIPIGVSRYVLKNDNYIFTRPFPIKQCPKFSSITLCIPTYLLRDNGLEFQL